MGRVCCKVNHSITSFLSHGRGLPENDYSFSANRGKRPTNGGTSVTNYWLGSPDSHDADVVEPRAALAKLRNFRQAVRGQFFWGKRCAAAREIDQSAHPVFLVKRIAGVR